MIPIIDYTLVSLFITINFIIYLTIHLPLDFLTYNKGTNRRSEESPPAEWVNKMVTVITIATTFYFWIIFAFIFLTNNSQLFYSLSFSAIFGSNANSCFVQIIGLIITGCSTIIACWGRISRGIRAISWGIPKKIEKKGLFRWIHHPLYASYCYYFIGLILIFQSLLVLPLISGIYGYYQTAVYEEKLLVEAFGQEYLNYQQKVGRFFPKLK